MCSQTIFSSIYRRSLSAPAQCPNAKLHALVMMTMMPQRGRLRRHSGGAMRLRRGRVSARGVPPLRVLAAGRVRGWR